MNNPQYLLRFDDICPTMNWKVWAEIESVLVQRRLKPILAVVPDNLDPVLQVDPPAADFWERVRAWQDRGWAIAMHGFQHRYVSRNAGLAARRRKSEFAGLPVGAQREKLRRGMEIFERERITSRVWIAPGNTFDATTVALLPEFGIDVISAGYFQFPYVGPFHEPSPVAAGVPPAVEPGVPPGGTGQPPNEPQRIPRHQAMAVAVSGRQDAALHGRQDGCRDRFMIPMRDGNAVEAINEPERRSPTRPDPQPPANPPDRETGAPVPGGRITWVPQQMHYFRPAPSGVWTVCYHHNQWNGSRLAKFREELNEYGDNIVLIEDILNPVRVCQLSAWLCTHPRVSEILIRGELKLWSWWSAGRRRVQGGGQAGMTRKLRQTFPCV